MVKEKWLYSIDPKFVGKYITWDYYPLILKTYYDWGGWGRCQIIDEIKKAFGKQKYNEFITDMNKHCFKKDIFGNPIDRFNINDIGRFYSMVLSKEFAIADQESRRIYKKCKICGDQFNPFEISPTYLGFPARESEVCYNCIKEAFGVVLTNDTRAFSKIKLDKKSIGIQLKKLYILLDKQIPTSVMYKQPSMMKQYITKTNHINLYKTLINMPYGQYYKQKFGSWFKALIYSGVLNTDSRRLGRGTMCLADDGHECLSMSEKIIDDWLFKNKIKHSKEDYYPFDEDLNPNKLFRSDWKIDKYYVEYFGLVGQKDYDNKILIKKEIVEKHKLNLIEIYQKDLIDLGKKLNKLKKH